MEALHNAVSCSPPLLLSIVFLIHILVRYIHFECIASYRIVPLFNFQVSHKIRYDKQTIWGPVHLGRAKKKFENNPPMGQNVESSA